MFKNLLLAALLSLPVLSLAQKDSTEVRYDDQNLTIIEISEADLEPFKTDEKYNYEIEKKDISWWEALKNWFYNLLRRFFEWLFGVESAPNYITAFLKYLPYLLLGLLLFLIIRFFIKANTKNILFSKGNENTVILSQEEQIIKTADIQALIQKALGEHNYRLAIRYYYLFLLKMLTERELIHWELQKTNNDYIGELSNSKLAPLFKRVTLLYDHIWYGEFQIDAQGYHWAKDRFDQLKRSITANA